MMQIGDMIRTPRFCTVRIADVLTRQEAASQGYMEPTHYNDSEYDILGKATSYFEPESGLCGVKTMIFAAIKK
jgi:hypothetical protein